MSAACIASAILIIAGCGGGGSTPCCVDLVAYKSTNCKASKCTAAPPLRRQRLPPGAALAGDVIDASGAIVPGAYTAMAAQLSKDAGLTYRYGPDAASYGVTSTGMPTLFKRTDQHSRCDPSGTCITSWQVGGPRNIGDAKNDQAAAGMYSTNQGSVTYVADVPAQRVGVTDIQISGTEFNTFAQAPQISWTIAGAAPNGGIDSLNVLSYKKQGIVSGDPIAAARCGGRAGFCGESVVVFQNGAIVSAGSNTASNKTAIKLPANKIPTAVAMTNVSEFALVTVWDTTAIKGQVAVVALAGLCDGCKVGEPSTYYDWWHEWMAVYPGLPNMGNIAFMKVLGYVDLPGMAAPTGIAVTTGLDQFSTMLANGNFMGLETPLTLQSNRQSFLAGGSNHGRYSKGGTAVVVSKSEQKAIFIDLKPLFTYVNSVYFGGDLATFNTTMSTLGHADSQWPHSFAFKPEQMPTVTKTVALDQRPTAVRTTIFGSVQRAWIATQEGSLRIFDTAGTEKGRVAVGRNPTSLGTSKGDPDNQNIEPLNKQVLVASRGDRKIQWVRFSADGNSGRVVRTLQDSRIIDPVAVEDADNFANHGYVLSIADYSGKAIRNYRYGPVIFADRGAQWACQPPTGCPVIPTGAWNMEFGGSFAVQGKPFQINTSNVP
jgi:hypothetical protein